MGLTEETQALGTKLWSHKQENLALEVGWNQKPLRSASCFGRVGSATHLRGVDSGLL